LPDYDFPIILSVSDVKQDYNDGFGTNSGLDIFINTPEMNNIETVKQLMEAIEKRLN